MKRSRYAIPYWAYGLLLLAFGYMLSSVWYASNEIAHINVEHIKQIDHIEDFSLNLAKSHLWLEEYLSRAHDQDNLNLYRKHRGKATANLDSLHDLIFRHEPEANIPQMMQKLDEHLLRLDQLARMRIADPQLGGIDSELDKQFDQEFKMIAQISEHIEDTIKEGTNRAIAKFHRNRKFLLVTAVMVMLLSFFILWVVDRGRKRAAEAALDAKRELHRNAAFLQAFYNATPDMIFLHGEDGRIVDVSDNAVARYRCPKEDLIQWELGRLMGKHCDVEIARRNLMQAMAGEAVDFEWVARAADGEEFPVEIRLRPLPEIEEERARVVAYVRDISTLKNAEQHVRESETRFRNLFEESPVSLWEEDFSAVKQHIEELKASSADDLHAYCPTHPEAVRECAKRVRIIDVNQATVKLHDAGSKQALMKGLTKTFTTQSLSAFRQEMLALVEGKLQFSIETKVQTLAGEIRDVIVSYSVLPGSEENWEHILVSLTDISENKRIFAHLNQAQNIAHIGSWELDPVHGDLWWSDEAYCIFEIDQTQFGASYEGFLEMVHPEDRDMVSAAYARHLETREPYDIIHRLLFEGERIKHVHERCDTTWNSEGKPLRSIGTVQDITEQVLADQEDQRQQEKMEHTQRLESLGVLAGGIAHDFNNILTAIMGNAALGRLKLDDAHPGLVHLARIEESSQRAAELCKQMLAYSGKGQFIVRPLNLSDMVDEITKLLEVSIAKNVVLKFHLAENLPAVDADTAQLQQVIMNLVINASDAIGKKSGVISISTGMMQADADYLEGAYTADDIAPGCFVFLEVADTGCGMDEATRVKMFDPFFTTKFTGRGLGMSAVLGIVRGHHGAIKVYSEKGRGTTFKVLLAASEAEASEQTENEAWGEWCGVGTVLIVDDEETIRETAAMMLKSMGFDTLTAEDGEKGVEVYRQHQEEIVAVLLDMTMPKMDGKACFRELRRINKDVRVILSSGYNEEDATNRFAGQGLAGFIQKPYTPEALRAKMKEALDRLTEDP